MRAVGRAIGVSEADATMCIMYVHERAAPGFVAKGLARTLSGKPLATPNDALAHRMHLSECRRHQGGTHGGVGVARRAARRAAKGGRSNKAEKRGARVVGRAMSVSGADTIRIQCTHTEESLPGSLRGPVRAWQGLKVVSRWLPNDTLKPIVRTSQNAKGIKVAPTEV